MKKVSILCVLCVFFALSLPVLPTQCKINEQISFHHNGLYFTYSLEENIKTSNQFDINYEINKYNRFSSPKERKQLLQKMLDVGFSQQVALNYLFPNLDKTIERLEKVVNTKPKDATLKINANSSPVFQITKEIVGKNLDVNTLYNKICHAYLNDKNLNFEVPIIVLEPNEYASQFEKISHLRADFSTDISSSTRDRKHNIKNSLSSLNKVQIAPNDVFSFNKTVGRRTQENGYRSAKIIVNNEFTEGIGGGVCQVSTTLYNAALLAGLEIVEANKHSKQVGYVQQGFDAMVNFGSSDLKFKNNTSETITIITNYSSSKARVRLFGEKKHASYKLTHQVFNIVEPNELVLIDDKQEYTDKVLYEDEFFYLKKANRGMEIKSYREKYENNQLISKELLRHDKYHVQDSVKIYGTKKREGFPSLFTIFDSLEIYGQHKDSSCPQLYMPQQRCLAHIS